MRQTRIWFLTCILAARLAAVASAQPAAAPVAPSPPAATAEKAGDVDDLQAVVYSLRAVVADLERQLGTEKIKRADVEIRLLRLEAAALSPKARQRLGFTETAASGPASPTEKPKQQ